MLTGNRASPCHRARIRCRPDTLSDAYKLANETPNIVYDLIIGGVLSATLVPVFTSLIVQERRSDDDERGFHAVVSAALLASTVLAVLAVRSPR